jgi:hypothetical protein
MSLIRPILMKKSINKPILMKKSINKPILMKRSINKPHINGVIDIGTGIPTRIRDLAPNAPIRLNTPNERTFTCANTEKMKALGFKPKYNIENFLTKPKKGSILNITNGEPA